MEDKEFDDNAEKEVIVDERSESKVKKNKLIFILLLLVFGSVISAVVFFYLHQIDDLSFPKGPVSTTTYLPKKYHRIKKSYPNAKFGIDISHHNGKILWDSVFSATQMIDVDFVIIKATEGIAFKDKRFKYNWKQLKRLGKKKAAYHFYNPNRNSLVQFENFALNVEINEEDMPPVLDIESLSRIQSVSSLRKGLLKWLIKAEEHYGKKPIIYTGDAFYRKHLKGHGFDEYPLWIANYNNVRKPKTKGTSIWQFTDKAKIKGIRSRVDVNVMLANLK